MLEAQGMTPANEMKWQPQLGADAPCPGTSPKKPGPASLLCSSLQNINIHTQNMHSSHQYYRGQWFFTSNLVLFPHFAVISPKGFRIPNCS